MVKHAGRAVERGVPSHRLGIYLTLYIVLLLVHSSVWRADAELNLKPLKAVNLEGEGERSGEGGNAINGDIIHIK